MNTYSDSAVESPWERKYEMNNGTGAPKVAGEFGGESMVEVTK